MSTSEYKVAIKIDGAALPMSKIYEFNSIPREGEKIRIGEDEVYKVLSVTHYPQDLYSFDVGLIVE